MLANMSDEFKGKIKMLYSVYPSSSAVLSALPHSQMEFYNSVLHMHNSNNHSDLTLMLANDSIYNVCKQNGFNLTNYDHHTINRMIALTAASVTSAQRFQRGSCSLASLVQKTALSQSVKYCYSAFAPVVASYDKDKMGCENMTKALFAKGSQMYGVAMKAPTLANRILYRGKFTRKEVNATC